ncbi:low-complexity protein [Candidatus Magnetobacterium bavaricum]|uniref:Low-complexity protein n=1 Tax=Candidatus Magnetobacterium bavaricum TaxID=29290 RepID=A0A0F3GJ18_9BACT|nr:low-complexity protein [Candidatus Magnetobacterium bavaricum]
MEEVIEELQLRDDKPGKGWDKQDALKYWCKICGPVAISSYIHDFLIRELRLRFPEEEPGKEILQWQEGFAKLFSYMLEHWMPIAEIEIETFRDMHFQSRNAEEALLVALNACALITKKGSDIKHPDATTFRNWLHRIRWQQSSTEPGLVVNFLSFLNLQKVDLSFANLRGAKLRGADLRGASLSGANLRETDLRGAKLERANLRGAYLRGAYLERTDLSKTDLREAILSGANLSEANLRGADFRGANFSEANLSGANLLGTDPSGANFMVPPHSSVVTLLSYSYSENAIL